jgi:hypothetical protein
LRFASRRESPTRRNQDWLGTFASFSGSGGAQDKFGIFYLDNGENKPPREL